MDESTITGWHTCLDWIRLVGLAYLAIGVAFSVIYYVLYSKKRIRDDDKSPTLELEKRRIEYSFLSEEVRRRGDLLATHGSIFVVAVFILMGQAALAPVNHRIVLVFTALATYSLFLFFSSFPTKRLDNIALARLRGIEEIDKFWVHRYMLGEIEDDCWVVARRFLWWFFLLLIVASGFFLVIVV